MGYPALPSVGDRPAAASLSVSAALSKPGDNVAQQSLVVGQMNEPRSRQERLPASAQAGVAPDDDPSQPTGCGDEGKSSDCGTPIAQVDRVRWKRHETDRIGGEQARAVADGDRSHKADGA